MAMNDHAEGGGRLGHQEVWELLPWYVNGTLEEEERRSVEGHLERCPLCRGEVRAGHELAVAVRRAAELPLATGRGLERLMARIDEEGAPQAPTAGDAGWWRRTPAAARWGLLVQAAVLAFLIVGLGWSLGRPGTTPATGSAPAPAAFETLGGPGPSMLPAAGDDAFAVRVVFAPDASAEALRRLLRSTGGEVTGGPSPAGVFTLTFTGTDATATLTRLRAAPEVELAERVVVRPVRGSGAGP
jgi:anti-sigma factor RsiW